MATSYNPLIHKYSNVKELTDLASLPSLFITRNPTAEATDQIIIKKEIPTIDFSLLMSQNSDQRSRVIGDIGKACKDWGCFTIINHGMLENLQTAMMEAFDEFFDLTIEEKQHYMGQDLFDPIRYGTSFNEASVDVRYWRDYLRIITHPMFSYPAKPLNFRKISEEYTRHMREISIELLRAISESLGLPEAIMEEALQLESCIQLLISNLYPPCPQPELALGLPPHSDSSIVTIVMQSNTKAEGLPSSAARWQLGSSRSHPELILCHPRRYLGASNGTYKSLLHRVLLNNESTRMSIVATIGPPLEALVSPLPQLVDSIRNRPAIFRETTYKEYVQLQKRNQAEKSVLNLIKL